MSTEPRTLPQPKRFSPKTALRGLWTAARPTGRAILGGAVGALTIALLAYAVSSYRLSEAPLLVRLGMLVIYAILGGLLAFLGQGVAKLLELFQRLPWRARWMLLGAVALLTITLMSFTPISLVVTIAYLLLTGLLLGGGMGALRARPRQDEAGGEDDTAGWRTVSAVRRAATVVSLVLGTVLLLGGLYFALIYRGMPAKAIPDAGRLAAGQPALINLPDPSQPGPYTVATLTYGSGNDRYRPEYGAAATIKTSPVDGWKLLGTSWQGAPASVRELVWGIDPAHLPLNARVWYPQSGAAEARYPLALIVHGNHAALDFSDAGYAYLGELLASRGFIVASVDENFLNGMPTDFTADFQGENDARGWLLLEHLRLWRAWNDNPSSPFYRKVDLDNIAVMGHSRGGEAAAVAALFNRLAYLPDDANLALDANFNIRAVVAIAPIDGQYTPAWRSTVLTNVNYLILQGSHDADLTSFSGIKQYERVGFVDAQPGEYFKAALYIYRANHGQFNTVWGDADTSTLRGLLLNRTALLNGEDQRQVAKTSISAFLEATLHGQAGYRVLFEDPRSAPAGWLPETVYINRYDASGDRLVSTYEEDVDLTSTTLAGGTIRALNFATWREQRLHSKWGNAENSVVYLGWNELSQPTYSLELPQGQLTMQPGSALIFNLADANQDPPSAAGTANGSVTRQPLDLSVMLIDASGQQSTLALGRYRPVQPVLEAQLYKAGLFERYGPSEPVLQSYALPLADFVQSNPAFNPSQVTAVRFVFDQTKRGSLILDAVGFRPAAEK